MFLIEITCFQTDWIIPMLDYSYSEIGENTPMEDEGQSGGGTKIDPHIQNDIKMLITAM